MDLTQKHSVHSSLLRWVNYLIMNTVLKQQMQGQMRQQLPGQPEQQIPFSPHMQQQQLKTSIDQLQLRQLPLQVQEVGQTRPPQTAVQQLQPPIESSVQYQGTSGQPRVSSLQMITPDYRQEQWHGHQPPGTPSPITLQPIKHEGDKSQVNVLFQGTMLATL